MRNAKQRRTESEVSFTEENAVQPEVEAQEVETEPNVELQPSEEEQQISKRLR